MRCKALVYRPKSARRHDVPKVLHETGKFRLGVGAGGQARQRGGGHRDERGRAEGRGRAPAALLGDVYRFSHYGMRGGGAWANDQARADRGQLGIAPGAAGGDFARARFGVDAALAALWAALRATIVSTRGAASASRRGMSAASGRFFQ